ncbi:NAD(P)-binding protein [uncultured Shewanella sp.]|uniref:NAD(P)-binding protein n=1 Tax=uncultured Shewanella sp. TaxID=173975 RepID=UPI002625D870|nr:NAD(P)-binding protein [uncultured Shewanella sp.]
MFYFGRVPSPLSTTVEYRDSHLPLNTRFCIIGAGTAGLTAATVLKKSGYNQVTVFDKNDYIGGHCCTTSRGADIGAIVFSPSYPYNPGQLAQSLGLEVNYLEVRSQYYSLITGKVEPYFNYVEKTQLLIEFIKYSWKHIFYKGVHFPRIVETSEVLHQSWFDFTQTEGFVQIERATRGIIRGGCYGKHHPALYGVRMAQPRPLLKYILQPKHSVAKIEGGYQQLFEKLADTYHINVKLGVALQDINREHGIDITWLDSELKSHKAHFDRLIIACNPQYLASCILYTKEENALYNQLVFEPICVYELNIKGILQGQVGTINLRENIDKDLNDRPLQVYKPYADKELCVLYVRPSDTVSAETILENIKNDFKLIGGEVTHVYTIKRWDDFNTTASKDSLCCGFFKKMERLQGANYTAGIGLIYTFDLLPHVMAQAEDVTKRLIRRQLPSEGVNTDF